MTFLRIHGASALITAVIWAGATAVLGPSAFILLAVLTLLEITFSFDNAVVNAKLVSQLSPLWQRLFMTAGILIAVAGVRFALPVVIVAVTARISLGAVIDLVLHQPQLYGQHLVHAGPLIDAAGGMFLLMIWAGFFLDEAKDSHWFASAERRLASLGRHGNLTILIMLGLTLAIHFTAGTHRPGVTVAALAGVTVHIALDLFGAVMDNGNGNGAGARRVKLTGIAAAVMFTRLEILDASFSFDGVIGAFALTSNVILIAAGLGAGALWVRSLTVQFVHAGTLAKYQYLEHGAHYAIGALGLIMIGKLYGLHLPEAVTGLCGLLFIGAAVISSIRTRTSDANGS